MSVDAMARTQLVRNAAGITLDLSGFDLNAFLAHDGAERDVQLLGVERLIRCLYVYQAEMIRGVAIAGSYTDDGHHSPRAWVEAVLNLSPATASRLVKTSAVLADVPALADAHRAGTVGSDQVEEFRRLHANPVCRAELRAHGYRLVGPAKHHEYQDFREILNRWRAHVNPDGTHRDHEASRERRRVRFGTVGHDGFLSAEGDAASVDEMIDILHAHIQSEFLQDCEERRIKHGDDADAYPLRRTHAQRCYDALQQIFRKSAAISIPGVPDPTVNIFTTETALATAISNYFNQNSRLADPDWNEITNWFNTDEPAISIGSEADSEPRDGDRTGEEFTVEFEEFDHDFGSGNVGEPVDDQTNHDWDPYEHGFAETERGSPVDPDDLVVAALLGRIRSIIITDDGRLLHAGKPKRLFTGRLRNAILMLGRHRCSRHGCHNSGPSIQADHTRSHACGGCTTADNGGPLCPLHNRDKYRLRHTVTHDTHGWHHYRPDGTEIAPRGS